MGKSRNKKEKSQSDSVSQPFESPNQVKWSDIRTLSSQRSQTPVKPRKILFSSDEDNDEKSAICGTPVQDASKGANTSHRIFSSGHEKKESHRWGPARNNDGEITGAEGTRSAIMDNSDDTLTQSLSENESKVNRETTAQRKRGRSTLSPPASVDLQSSANDRLKDIVAAQRDKYLLEANAAEQCIERNVLHARSPFKQRSNQRPHGKTHVISRQSGKRNDSQKNEQSAAKPMSAPTTPKLHCERSNAPHPSSSNAKLGSKTQSQANGTVSINVPQPPLVTPSSSLRGPNRIDSAKRFSASNPHNQKSVQQDSSPHQVSVGPAFPKQRDAKCGAKKAKKKRRPEADETGPNAVLAEARRQAQRLHEHKLRRDQAMQGAKGVEKTNTRRNTSTSESDAGVGCHSSEQDASSGPRARGEKDVDQETGPTSKNDGKEKEEEAKGKQNKDGGSNESDGFTSIFVSDKKRKYKASDDSTGRSDEATAKKSKMSKTSKDTGAAIEEADGLPHPAQRFQAQLLVKFPVSTFIKRPTTVAPSPDDGERAVTAKIKAVVPAAMVDAACKQLNTEGRHAHTSRRIGKPPHNAARHSNDDSSVDESSDNQEVTIYIESHPTAILAAARDVLTLIAGNRTELDLDNDSKSSRQQGQGSR